MHKIPGRALLLLYVCVSSALAQESLTIGPGDRMHVQVFDTPEMDQHPRVTDAGTAPLLFLGDLKVAGLTPGDAARAIEDALKQQKYMLHPQVAVTIEEYANEQISIMGQVKNAGVYEITTPTTILSVLSMAGGLTDLADRHITIQRRGNPKERVTYFVSNNSNQAFEENERVYPGDTVLVPKVPIVYVIGDVARPGGYPMTTNDSRMSALQAVALAGFTNKTAIESKTKLIRRDPGTPQEIALDLSSIQKGASPDVDLHPDDVIFVPFSWMKNIAISSSSIAATTAGAAVYSVH